MMGPKYYEVGHDTTHASLMGNLSLVPSTCHSPPTYGTKFKVSSFIRFRDRNESQILKVGHVSVTHKGKVIH